MAEVKDFNSYKKESDLSYKEKIRSHRLRVFYRWTIGIIIVVVVFALFYVQWRDKKYSEARIVSTVSDLGLETASVKALGNTIFQYSKDGMSCLSASGDAKWNQTYEMKDPMVRTCQNAVAVGDYNGHMIYVANTDGILGQVDTNLPIRDFCVASQGVVAAVLDDVNTTWINLYDAQGNSLANIKTTMKDSGYPLAISLSPNGQILCVSFLNTEEGDIKSSIAFYNFGSVGQNVTDNYVSGYDYSGAVAPIVQYLNSSSAFAVTGDRIMFYGGDQVPESKAENLFTDEEVRSVYHNQNYVGLVFANSTSDGTYRLQVYNTDGKLVMTHYFDFIYTDILFDGDQVAIYNDSQWQLLGMDGSIKYEGNFETAVKAMIPGNSRNKFTIATGSQIQQLQLR